MALTARDTRRFASAARAGSAIGPKRPYRCFKPD